MSDRSRAITPQPNSLPLWQRYRSVKRLGRSRFCQTDLAVDSASNFCVIKQFLLPEPPDFMGLADIAHPQLPHLIEQFDRVLVFEFVSGESLAQSELLDANQIWQLLLDLLPVLQTIHARGWLHGDIKPENIIQHESVPVLVDLDGGLIASNAGYAAPEAASGQPEAASDLFSLGLTCVHLLTGVHPFELQDGDWQAHLPEPIDPALERILDRLLQPNPRRRYQTAQAVLRDLRVRPGSAAQSNLVRPAAAIAPRQTWNCRQVLSGHSGEITALAVSPDSYFFASGSSDRTVKLWDVESGQLVQTFAGRSLWSGSGHRGRINALSFSPDGHLLLSGSDDGTIKLWDLANKKLIQTIDAHDWGVDALATQNSMLASGGGDGTISLWDLDAGQQILPLGKHGDRVNALAFSPDGTLLASSSSDTTVRLWDLDRQRLIYTLSGHSASVLALAFVNDRTLISGSADRTLKFWQCDRGELLTTVAAHKDAITALAIAPPSQENARLLASASADHMVKLWDLTARRRVATLAHDWSLSAIAFTPTGLLISGSSDETIRIWQH